MRFMMLMYPDPKAETGVLPDPEALEKMMAFNQLLVDAGVMLGGDGLHPSKRGARIRFGRGKTIVLDGPFTETKEILGGYWMIRAASLAEAIEWARKAPCPEGEMIEIRQVYEIEEFGPEVAAREGQMLKEMEAGRKN